MCICMKICALNASVSKCPGECRSFRQLPNVLWPHIATGFLNSQGQPVTSDCMKLRHIDQVRENAERRRAATHRSRKA